MNSQKPTYTLNRRPVIAAALPAMALVACALVNSASAQSSDAIINKLVAKGVLTEQEAKELKQEANQDFTKAYQVKSGLPEWVTSLKLGGDFRGRYEGFFGDDPAFQDRNRLRYRVRVGLVATLKDNFEVGFRLTSDEAAKDSPNFGGDPIGANTTFQDNGSKKFVYIDLAYGKWKMLNSEEFKSAWTVGKMENPFVLSEMVFDPDYTPEGLAQQFTYNLNEAQALKLNLGGFVLDEFSQRSDPWLVGAQALWDAKWSSHLQSSLGVAALYIDQSQLLTNGSVPNMNSGNVRSGGTGVLASDFYPVVGSAFLTYSLDSFPCYTGAFPIRVGGEFMHNPGADSANIGYWTGLQFGKSGKKGAWEASYRWKYLEGDAWWEELVDSDFGAFYGGTSARGSGPDYRAGTNVRGHVVRASYSPYNALTLGVSCSFTELIDNAAATDSGMTRLQVDAILKF